MGPPERQLWDHPSASHGTTFGSTTAGALTGPLAAFLSADRESGDGVQGGSRVRGPGGSPAVAGRGESAGGRAAGGDGPQDDPPLHRSGRGGRHHGGGW